MEFCIIQNNALSTKPEDATSVIECRPNTQLIAIALLLVFVLARIHYFILMRRAVGCLDAFAMYCLAYFLLMMSTIMIVLLTIYYY